MKRNRIFLIVSVVLLFFCSGLVVYVLYLRAASSEFNSVTDTYVADGSAGELEDKNDELASDLAASESLVEDLKSRLLILEGHIPAVLPETVIMDVKKYAQTHPASCESASAHVVMDYFGSDFSEDSIIEEIGADLSPRHFDADGNLHWGNPQKTFVGDIDGKNVYVDGYGVYNEPIAKVLKNHGFSASISRTGWKIEELLNHVRRGYPAIVWISSNYQASEVGTMIGPDGIENPWIWGEHAVVLRGVDRDEIYIMDVGNGSYYTVSYSKFETGFANLNNMAIIVIPDES